MLNFRLEFVEMVHTIYAQKAFNEKSDEKLSFYLCFCVQKLFCNIFDGFQISNQFFILILVLNVVKKIIFLILAQNKENNFFCKL